MDDRLQSLQHFLLETLQAFPEGIREYDLIQCLSQQENVLLNTDPFRDHLSLFQTHFLLFHVLYRLQQEVVNTKAFSLEISSLLIQLKPYQASTTGQLNRHDPLRDYYLDIDQLQNTNQQDVTELLDSFWRRFAGLENRGNALLILGLEDPVSDTDIKLQYRRLAMQHHPDRGGEAEVFHRITIAGRWLGVIG